jgi:hypothetical protein
VQYIHPDAGQSVDRCNSGYIQEVTVQENGTNAKDNYANKAGVRNQPRRRVWTANHRSDLPNSGFAKHAAGSKTKEDEKNDETREVLVEGSEDHRSKRLREANNEPTYESTPVVTDTADRSGYEAVDQQLESQAGTDLRNRGRENAH